MHRKYGLCRTISIEGADNSDVFTDNLCKFTASVTDGNRLSIHLDAITLPGKEIEKLIYVAGKKGDKTVICGINVKRKAAFF